MASALLYILGKLLSWFGVTVATGLTADLAEGTASITTGTTALTVAGVTLTQAHVGKTVAVKGGGGADVPLLTTIAAVGSASTATVALAASATVAGALCAVGTNNAVALQAAVTAAAGGTLVIPPGGYLVAANVATVASDGAIVTVPSNTTVLGFPRKSRLHHLGSDNNNTGYFNALFRVADASTGVRFLGMHFTSDNKSSFTYVLNCQANAIDIQLTATRDVWVMGCTFDDLWGFSVHDRGNNQRIHACCNVMRNCSNGLNVNSDYSLQLGNWFEGGEGIEASGKFAVVALNIFKDCRGVGISAGGDTTVGSIKPLVVLGNLIDGVAAGVGIITAQSFVGGIVAANVVRRADLGGIQIGGALGGILGQWTLVAANVVTSNCVDPGVNVVGILLGGGNTGPQFAIGNVALDGGLTGYNQKYGLQVAADNCFVAANYLSGTTKDYSVSGTGCRFVANASPNGSGEITAALANPNTPAFVPTGATGARPSTPGTGQQFFDTTLHKLITWDGAVWRDGAGTSV